MDTEAQDSAPCDIQMSRKSLYTLFRDSTKRKLDEKLLDMEQKVKEIMKCPANEFRTIRDDLRHFKSELKQRWSLANNTEARFFRQNKNWLDSCITMHSWSTMSTSKQGRPSKSFQELTERSKRRKTKELREQVPVQELTYAASVSQRKSGNIEASKIIKEVTATPTRAKKYKKMLCDVQKVSAKKHSASEALSLFIECDLTKRQYEILHESNKIIYPCYSLIKEAKKQCYPREESMRITETCAEVHLQDLLNHTVSRLCKYLEDVLETCTPEELLNMELITKWGCDGSQQTRFQQNFQDDSGADDANIFQSSLVPIRLQSNIENHKKILWQNPTPSSPRFCRPIRIRFLHETADITRDEIKYIEDQVDELTKTEIRNSNDVQMNVLHTLVPTMVDAKVRNAATNTSSTMRCYICGKTSKDFNDFKATKTENPEALRFGISVLHARIRLFETLLHIAYKLPLKKWQARGLNEKNIVKQTKERVQKEFKEKTGLIVDVPKAGFGNSNSGNTSRRFFSDPETAAEITGIDICLIQKLRVILEAISSGYEISESKFTNYANETAELYVKLYGWHPMTPTLHKILVHGPAIIKHALLPIGQLSEVAAEARNKHFRSYRLDFTRKFSRELCNKDVFNRLLLTSDPFISCGRKRQKLKRSRCFLPETMQLFLEVGPENMSNTPVCDVNSLVDVEVSLPSVQQTDVLVEVKATAINPIDAKQRVFKPSKEILPRILGWDGAGVVVSKGEKANLFNVGDEVFFTGELMRSGANAQYMAVHQYLVGKKPKNITFEQAAAMPIAALTSFESLYDRLLLSEKDKGKSLLIINSAGGVGSVATQIAKNLGLKVIGTASRPETAAFTREFGAEFVLNHTQDLIPQLEANGFGAGVDFILVNHDPVPYWDTLMKAVKPQGRICLIVEGSAPVDLGVLKDKSLTLVSERMFTRVMYDTEDRIRQYDIFNQVSKWLEEGKLKSILTKTMSPINAANLREAHRLIEEKRMIGKLVLSGF